MNQYAAQGRRRPGSHAPNSAAATGLCRASRSLLCVRGRDGLTSAKIAPKIIGIDRITAAIDYFNQAPVVHTRTYKLDTAA
jgi:hypothetical protein